MIQTNSLLSLEDQLKELLGESSLEDLQKEVTLLQKIKSLSLPTFKQKLEDLCGDYRLYIDTTSVTLIDDESDEELQVPIELQQEFFKIHNNKEHWITKCVELSPKEILLLLYKFPERL